jgi:hypothetical protein
MEIHRWHFRSDWSPGIRLVLSLALIWTSCLFEAAPLFAPVNPSLARLTFTKQLKGSSPEYMKIIVNSNGVGSYEGRKLDDPSNPRALRLSPATTRRLFELAALLNNCKTELESHKKVANLGLKTLLCETGSQTDSVQINYTQRREAQELTELFERIASVEQHIISLEYDIKYDHLSLPRELLQIEIDLDHNALTDAERMVPALEQIVKNPKFLRLAQLRAQNILERIQNNE